MKKIMAVVLSLAVLFAFAACSDGPTKFFGKDVLGVVVESTPDYIENEVLNPADVDLRVIFNDGSEAVYSGSELGMSGTFKLTAGANKFTVNFGLVSGESSVESKSNEVVINAAEVTKLVIDPTNAPKELLPAMSGDIDVALNAAGLVFKAEYGNGKSKEVSLDLAKELVSGLALTKVEGNVGDELEIKVTTGDNAEVSPKWTVTIAEAEDYFKEFRVTQILDKEHKLFNIGADDKPHTLEDVELAVSAVYEKDGIEVVRPLEIGDATDEVSVSWGKYADTFDLRRTDKNAPTSVVLTLNAEDEDDDIVRTVSIPGGIKFTEDYATEVNVAYKNGATKLELTAGALINSNMFDYYAKEWASGKDVKDADKGDAIADSSLFEVKPGRVPYGTPAGETVDLTFTYEANSEVEFIVGSVETVTVVAE